MEEFGGELEVGGRSPVGQLPKILHWGLRMCSSDHPGL